MKLQNTLFVILASKNLKVYQDMINMRRLQLQKYKIPYIFLLDGTDENGDPIKDSDLLPDERYYPNTQEIMSKTKIHVLSSNIIFRYHSFINEMLNDPTYDHITHIFRLNVSTFTNINMLNTINIPDNNCIYGSAFLTHLGDPYLSGTAILYSRDVMEYFSNLDIHNMNVCYDQYDDTAIGWILGKKYNQQDKLRMYWKYNESDYTNDYLPEMEKYHLVRVRNDKDRDIVDKKIWKMLLFHFDHINYDNFDSVNVLECFKECKKNNKILSIIFIFILILVFICLYFFLLKFSKDNVDE